jgi:hypothetical protein
MPTAALIGSATNAGEATFVLEKIPIARESYTKSKSYVQLSKDKEIMEKRRKRLCFDLLVFQQVQRSTQTRDTTQSVLVSGQNLNSCAPGGAQ